MSSGLYVTSKFHVNMSIRNILVPTLKTFESHYPFCTESQFQKSIQVSILGASSQLGKYTSFLMKQNPLISGLHLQGCYPIENMGVDLNFFDTKCHVEVYCGMEKSISKAVKSADVVLVLPAQKIKPTDSLGDRIMKEGKRLYNIAAQCTVYAPRAILIVCVPPVSVTLPLVTEVFRKTNFYHPGRIVGSAAIAQVKANTIFGRYQDLDPQNCYVPLIGGPELDLAVPLYSKAKPVEVVGKNGSKILTARFRGVKEDDFPEKLGDPNFLDDCPLAESYALNQLVSTIALGICGDPNAFANVYLRSNALQACKYLVSTVRFSRGGVVHNCGVPQLTKLELDLVERAALQIKEREQMALDYLEYLETKQPKAPAFTEKEKHDKEILEQKIIR